MKKHICPLCMAVFASHKAYETHQAHTHNYSRPNKCLPKCSGRKLVVR
jgi:uncharacterized C2H2 Zn-finger protein